MDELKNMVKKYWLSLILCFISLKIINYIFGSVCYSTILFGVPCPSCGITRATKLLLTGHLRESFQMHPLLILVIIGVLLYPILKQTRKNYMFLIKLYVVVCIVIFISFYLYRMKMYFPTVEPMVYREDNFLVRIRDLWKAWGK